MFCKQIKISLLLLIIVYSSTFYFGECLESSLSRCCNIGVRWAWENKTCGDYPGPVAGIESGHQAPCLSTIDACCRRNYRERQCFTGHETAKAGNICNVGFGQGGHYHQDCCEGCKLGLIAGSMGLNCEFQSLRIALGPPWDSSITKCCLQSGGTGRYIPGGGGGPSTELSIPNRNNGQSGLTENRDQNMCDLFPGQLCTQICTPENNSYQCSCRPGFTLLPDGKTCGPTNQKFTQNRISPSEECPIGFLYNKITQICDDLDECDTVEGERSCYPYKVCKNTIGSFICESPRDTNISGTAQCPPGFQYDQINMICDDVDECRLGYDICIREIQFCINTYGGFDCQSKKDLNLYNCPAGYKFNNVTLSCEDVDECEEMLDSCEKSSENCRNTPGAYECEINCSEGHRYDNKLKACQDINECIEGTHDCKIEIESCVNIPGSYQCHQLVKSGEDNCPPGFETSQNFTFICQDSDECTSGVHTCSDLETCINEIGGYHCEPTEEENETEGSAEDYESSSDIPNGISELDSLREGLTRQNQNNNNRRGENINNNMLEKVRKCGKGFRPGIPARYGEEIPCEDIDECLENACPSTSHCQNTIGSFYCYCRNGFYRDPITNACLDVNECLGQHSCLTSQRCDNTIGSYSCIRITGCGTGYTLDAGTGQCIDDDECLHNTHDCHRFGADWQCKNTIGSFTCERAPKRCPSGMSLAPNGDCRPAHMLSGLSIQSSKNGDCTDVDECLILENTRSPCTWNQNCVNTLGSFQCMSKIICPSGFEPDTASSKCIDIDECTRGTHTCSQNQICLNRGGGYICQCPQGYTYNQQYGVCNDIDECSNYGGQVCSSNSICHNRPGNFICICKEGFIQGKDNKTCIDEDECRVSGLCEQNCVNTWGSYKCSCRSGFTLSDDNRTCRDLNECEIAKAESNYLCLGLCINTHGSYKCDCPSGYNLSQDSRTCTDIDECNDSNTCQRDESCLNTRGGFRCNKLNCPYGYQRDGESPDRCKKAIQCSDRDLTCQKQPLTISRNYISFTSNIRIPSTGYIDLFTMRGPNWPTAVMHFTLEMKNNRASPGIAIATRDHFLLRRPESYQAIVSLAKPILSAPQDVELELMMEVYNRGNFAGSASAQIILVVTKQDF